MENFKKIILSNKNFILWLLTSIILTSGIMILLYQYTKPNKSLTSLKLISKELNNSNYSLNNCIEKSTINPNLTIELLTKNIELLKQLKLTLSSTVITDDDMILLYNNILSSIDSTQSLNIYCLNLLDSSNINSESISEVIKLKNTCLDSYKKASILGISLDYSNNAFGFFNNYLNYITNLQKMSKDNVIKELQTKEFFNYFNQAFENFTKLLQDIEPAVIKIRNDNRSIDILLNDIYEKELEFIIIKRNLNYISIPINCQNYYNSLTDSFTIYSTYLTSIKTALIYEKSSNSYKDNKKEIDKYYKNAYDKFDDTKASVEILKKALENL